MGRGIDSGLDMSEVVKAASAKKPEVEGVQVAEDAIREITEEEIYKQGLASKTEIELEMWFRGVLNGPDKKGVLKSLREKVKHELSILEKEKNKLNPEKTEMVEKTDLEDRFIEAIRKLESDQKIIISFLDLDSFKILNDTLGHSVGDQVIESFTEGLRTSMASSLQLAFRDPQDVTARLGGDEFGFLMTVSADADDSSVVNRIVSQTQYLTNRPSIAAHKETDIQELSVGYAVLSFEEVQNFFKTGKKLHELFVEKYKEADHRSRRSKHMQYLEKDNHVAATYKKLASNERIVGPKTKDVHSQEQWDHAEAIHDYMRANMKQFTKAEEGELVEHASLIWELSRIKDSKVFKSKLAQFGELAQKLYK